MAGSLCIRNIGRLLTLCPELGQSPDPGHAALGIISEAALVIDQGQVAWIGSTAQAPAADRVLEADGRLVMPGLIDCHTHLVFGGDRSDEFVRRCRGESYESIARAGGGILSTVQATRQADEDELLAAAKARLDRILLLGVTTLEAKSGYGLDLSTELKLLRVVQRLDAEHPIDLVPTFLGAHSVPPEYKGDRRGYLRLVIDEMLPAVARDNLAEFCDIFCEKGVFDTDESRELLLAARSVGLTPKVHAEQLHRFGGVDVAIDVGAASCDHLEMVTPAQIERLAASETVAVLLPSATLFLGSTHFAPARQLLDAGVTVALATDLNPGSSMTEHLPLMTTLAAVYMGMSPGEAISGITVSAARALRRDSIGKLQPGCPADLLLTDLRHENQLPYRMAHNCVTDVFKDGRQVVAAGVRISG